MLSFRTLAPALLALAGYVVAQDLDQTTSTQPESTQTLSAQTLSAQTLSTQSLSTWTVSIQTLSNQTLSTQTLSTQTLSTQTLSTQTLTTQTVSIQTLPIQRLSSQTASSQTLSSQAVSDQTTLSQVVLTTTSSTRTKPTQTQSAEKEKPTIFSEYGCVGRNQTVEPDNSCQAFGTDLEEYFAGISVPSGTVCDWYEASDCTDKFWNYMQFPGDCQFGYFARTRAKSIKCYRDRHAF